MVFSFNIEEFLVYEDHLDDEFLVVMDERILFRSYEESEIMDFIYSNLEEEV